jgi:hypothetical protein
MTADSVAPHIVFHPSWPGPAQTLVRRAIDRHGGWSLWSRLRAVTIQLDALRGFLPWFKGYGRTFQLASALTTFPKEGRTEWHEPGAPASVVYCRGDMDIRDPDVDGGRRQSLQHRRTFRGLRKLRRWTVVDAHYFFGYAFASYAAVPFVLPNLIYQGPAAGVWRGEHLEGVRVRYPPGADVHSPTQSYLFEAGGLLRRNDYVADVVGSWAVGAHIWQDFVTVQGLPVPSRRTVFRRLGRWALPFPVVLDASFSGLAVDFLSG